MSTRYTKTVSVNVNFVPGSTVTTPTQTFYVANFDKQTAINIPYQGSAKPDWNTVSVNVIVSNRVLPKAAITVLDGLNTLTILISAGVLNINDLKPDGTTDISIYFDIYIDM